MSPMSHPVQLQASGWGASRVSVSKCLLCRSRPCSPYYRSIACKLVDLKLCSLTIPELWLGNTRGTSWYSVIQTILLSASLSFDNMDGQPCSLFPQSLLHRQGGVMAPVERSQTSNMGALCQTASHRLKAGEVAALLNAVPRQS